MLKECHEPDDIRERTASWVAKTTGMHLPSVIDMLQGNTPWPRWSKKLLFRVCEMVSHLFTQIEVRENLGDKIATEVRKTLLESESHQLREVRLFLNLVRLGPGDNKDYLAKITTEVVREDF
mgnify:CR=1 FL=1